MTIAALLQTSATIQRRAASTTDSHGNPVTATTASTSVLCYLEQTSRDEVEGSQDTARAEYLLVLPAGTSIDASDRIVIGSTTYQLVGIPWSAKRATNGAEHHIEATVVEVTG